MSGVAWTDAMVVVVSFLRGGARGVASVDLCKPQRSINGVERRRKARNIEGGQSQSVEVRVQ